MNSFLERPRSEEFALGMFEVEGGIPTDDLDEEELEYDDVTYSAIHMIQKE